ncbi:hypothetical protein CEP54_015607 [Fusarium duplospermum]|uniref:Uncharacterized protein n=1 Tax=Fusarium duplospermum TaxID=1325734 RepID=A0A428NMS4_9HYPO|nr:hypothetical protein CEP54_015607 [Fusarium duplospermum]
MGTKYAYGSSFNSPDGRNDNCVATALARMEGYENADRFQEDTIRWRMGDSKFGAKGGMFSNDVDKFRTKTGQQFKKETFIPTLTQSAYDVMKASFNIFSLVILLCPGRPTDPKPFHVTSQINKRVST